MQNIYSCAICPEKPCSKGLNQYPKKCPTIEEKETIENSISFYKEDIETNKIMNIATKLIKDEFGNLRSRAEEIKTLIKEMNFKKIGIAFCLSMSNETKKFVNMLSDLDIEIISVCCKVGSIPAEEIINNIEITNNKKFTAICNPVVQAKLLNKHKTDINIVIGLCVGHDIIFNKHIKGLVTTLATKDRKHNHCPTKELS